MAILHCPGCGDDSRCLDFYGPGIPVPVETIAVIVGLGTNDLEIPCLTFATVAEAERFLTARFGPADSRGRWGPVASHDMRYCADDFFFAYHDGCGGLDFFEVRTVRHGKPIVSFDLD
jgi:hypothetical protein